MPAKNGDTVRVHYTGTLDDGTCFDSSEGRAPLEFQVGSGQVIPGFDEAVRGLEPGQSRTVTIEAEQAYGPYRHEMVLQVGREHLPPGLEPNIGDELVLETDQGQPLNARVVDSGPQGITLDANHPLAGQNLTFEIELHAIV